MSIIQETVQGISEYKYKKTPNLGTAISYVVSINKETNRQPDKYSFWVDKYGVVDEETGEYLHNLITPDSHENPYLGLVEYSAIWQLDSWSTKEDSKRSVWISPELKREGEYDENKIVIHEIEITPAGQRKVNNIMVIFECDRNECLQIAKQLFPNKTKDVSTPEELRSMLIDVGDDISIVEIIDVLTPYIPKNEDYKPPSEDTKIYLGGLIAQGAPSYFVAKEFLRLGAIGPYSLVCLGGSSYLDMLNANSLVLGGGKDKYGSLKFNCPSKTCGKENVRPINVLLTHCQHCGKEIPRC